VYVGERGGVESSLSRVEGVDEEGLVRNFTGKNLALHLRVAEHFWWWWTINPGFFCESLCYH